MPGIMIRPTAKKVCWWAARRSIAGSDASRLPAVDHSHEDREDVDHEHLLLVAQR